LQLDAELVVRAGRRQVSGRRRRRPMLAEPARGNPRDDPGDRYAAAGVLGDDRRL